LKNIRTEIKRFKGDQDLKDQENPEEAAPPELALEVKADAVKAKRSSRS
jgi:hypothetical protein